MNPRKLYFKEHLELEPGEYTYGIRIELRECIVLCHVDLKHGSGHRANIQRFQGFKNTMITLGAPKIALESSSHFNLDNTHRRTSEIFS